MVQSYKQSLSDQLGVSRRTTARSRLLISSGVVRKFEKESMMAKFKKRMEKWGLTAAKAGLAASLLMGSASMIHAGDFDGIDGLDFGAIVQRGLEGSSFIWFGIQQPLGASAPSTTGNYRTAQQSAADQVLLAKGLKAEYVTRNVGNAADQFAFWPNDENPTHLIFCIEGSRQDLGTFLPGGVIKKFNPSVQRIRIQDGTVETILRGMTICDGVRRTSWGTILPTEETDDGAAYEIIDPLNVTNHTIVDRATGQVIDQNGLPSTKVAIRLATGLYAWEGIGILPNGVMYTGDEERPGTSGPDADGGTILKFVPANPRTQAGPITDLNQSPFAAGNLYALQVSCQGNTQQYGQGCEVGHGAWVLVNPLAARADADKAGATGYYRPEDLELDPKYQDANGGVRFCWANTQNEGAKSHSEVVCGIDSAPLVASATQRTVEVNRFIEGDTDFNQADNIEFQPKTNNVYVIEDNPNGDIFACLPDGADRDIKSDGCIKILSVKDSSAEPTGFKFSADGRTAYVSIQHSNDGNMPLFDDYRTDDIIKISGFKIPFRFQQ